MNEELDVLKIVTQSLNQADIPYMISGSIAANYYTVPRMTRDIDVHNLLNTVEDLDTAYINGWVKRLGLEQVYGEAKERY